MKKLIILLFCTFLLAAFQTVVFAQQQIGRQIVRPVRSAVVNMKQMADLEALLPKPPISTQGFIPNENDEYEEPPGMPSPYESGASRENRVMVLSPSPVINYAAAPDEAQGGGAAGTYTIPPDTYGAVGLDKVFVTVNNNYKILNKTTGAQLSLVSMPSFWSPLGADGAGPFDPRTIYDPYNNRWILAAVSNGGAAASRVLLAISQTHDPQGSYNLYAFDPDAGTTLWADYPTLGYNKNWIAIAVNNFTIAGGAFSDSKIFVLDYPTLLAGTATATAFAGSGLFTFHFAETQSATENTLYGVNHVASGAATYRFHTITGTAAVPVLTVGASNLVRTGGGWTQPNGNVAPQTCITPPCPGTLQFMDVGDARVSGNVVFRNNTIWYSQTVGLPSGVATRMGAQWTKLNTSGAFLDGGRMEIPTATNANGEHWYTYPSIAVNSSNDVLMGMTKTESDGFAGAAYCFRYSTDAAGTMQDALVYKDGEDYYDKTASGRTRWGDYSHTVTDPLDDASFWTIQEYAKLRAAPSVFGTLAKWGTWIAKVAPNACLSNIASGNWNVAGTWGCGSVPTASNHVNIVSGHNVTLDVDPLAASITVNSGGTLTINTTRTLSCKLIVYGTLNITGGKLTLGANDVFLAQGATLTGASSTSYFVTNSTGKVTKIIAAGGSFEFPVSPNTTSYNSLTIANSSGPIEVFSVRVSAGITPSSSNNASCVQRTWNINEMTTGGNGATLTFKWAAAEHGGTFNPLATPYAYRHNGSTYLLVGSMTIPALASGIYSSNTVSPVSTFSPWIVSGSSALPIVLEYFTGTKMPDASHKLEWKANCTGPFSKFEVQRSHDGKSFSNMTRIDADYNRCLQPFDFTDQLPLQGKNFYRIRYTDETGKVAYTKTILLLNSKTGFEIVNLQPNPVTSLAILNYSVASKQELSLMITDSKGSRVMQKTINAATGSNQEELDLSSLSSGTYLLTLVSSTGDQKAIRIVKQ